MPRPPVIRTDERAAISAALNTYMERTGIGQGKLAGNIGIPRLSLINYLECRQTPRPRALGKMKAFFGPNFPRDEDGISPPASATPSLIPPMQRKLAFEGEIYLETHDSLVSARLTRKQPNSLELIVEIRRTGSD